MPKKKNETEQQWLARVRAARAYTNIRQDDGTEIAAFMALFHPDYPEDKTRGMIHDARQRQKARR